MALHLPALPVVPAFLHRRPVEPKPEPKPEPWPGNPRTVADDLRESLANEAELAATLREVNSLLDTDLVAENNRLRREVESLHAIIKQLHEDVRQSNRDAISAGQSRKAATA